MNEIVTEKRCSKCKKWKPLSEFPGSKKGGDKYGLRYQCKDCHNKHASKYRDENPDRLKLIYKMWRLLHPEKVKEDRKKNGSKRTKAWMQKNPEKRVEYRSSRRALKKSGGRITAKEWRDMKKFYNYTCLHCKRAEPEIKLTLDHVIPLAPPYNGRNTIDNAQPLCLSCNSSKGKKHIDYRL